MILEYSRGMAMTAGTVDRYFDDIKMGKIVSPEGEHIFRRLDWHSTHEPQIGMRVSFESSDGRAFKIIVQEQAETG